MAKFLVFGNGKPWAQIQANLSDLLPGLGLTLTRLDEQRALVDSAVLRSLQLQYKAGAEAALAEAGISKREALDDTQVQQLLDTRPPQPQRPEVDFNAAGASDWHLRMVKAPQAWKMMGGVDVLQWGSVRVGQIDTGFTRHEALGFGTATAWVQVADGLTDFAPSANTVGMDGPGNGEDSLSGIFGGHGTRTGATVCGRFRHTERDFYGVAPRVPLVPVRIADHVLITHAQLNFARAVDHLVDQAQVGVINLSMGFLPDWPQKQLRAALNKAYESGVIMVCAAGQPLESVVSPACRPRTLAVAGVDRQGAPWTDSARGDEVDISAPAVNVPVATTRSNGSMGYDTSKGTSYAAAMTSGAAALWLLHRGADIAASYAQPWQRVEAFTRLVRATTTKPTGWRSKPFGTGILNIEDLLLASLPAANSLQRQTEA